MKVGDLVRIKGHDVTGVVSETTGIWYYAPDFIMARLVHVLWHNTGQVSSIEKQYIEKVHFFEDDETTEVINESR